jgi:hypothetical protein
MQPNIQIRIGARCRAARRRTSCIPPRGGSRALVVGNGPDFSAIPNSGFITETEGSFDSSSNITSECAVACSITTSGIVCPTSPSCAGSTDTNDYSLQLNSKPFDTTACTGNSAPSGFTCQGWEQFVYESHGTGFIQYWLEHWSGPGGTCPAPHGSSCVNGSVNSTGWCEQALYGQTYCVVNAVKGTTAISEPIANIGDFHVTAFTAGTAGMTTDSLGVSVTGGMATTAPGNNYFPDLGSKWNEAEFNVFGNGGGDQAVFNNNSSLTVRIGELSGTTVGPTCDDQSFTGESNNFTLDNSPPPSVLPGTMPALVFTEVNPAPTGTAASCVDATSVGDTHLTTFDGLYYDFQAYGDFILAQSGSNFEVQTRQQPGPPGYPNTAVNKAVAVRMGASTVAIYLLPARLVINGKVDNLASGKSTVLSTGVQIKRLGSEYIVSDGEGDHVTVSLQPQWINVTVGLGRGASKTRGLLGNPEGNAQVLATSNGVVLKDPVSFNDLYNSYAASWRVQPKDSLFTGPTTIAGGVPTAAFFASNIDPQLAGPALAKCKAAGIVAQDLLESCVLDSVVLNDVKAIKVFVHLPVPIHVIKPVLHMEPLPK